MHLFADFTRAAAGIVREGRNVPARIAHQLVSLLGDPDLVPGALREPADSYKQSILYVEPEGLFSVVALTWGPRQATPVHDHICWCVVGIYEGSEREEIYLPSGTGLGDLDRVVEHRTGEVYWHDTDAPNIHRVSNPAIELAISIHVYGADIRKFGTSIRRCYPVARTLVP